MNLLNLVTESYDRQARLYPALLLITPVVLTGVAIFSEALTALQSLGSLLVGFGGAFLLTQLARDAGKNREPTLYKLWGGMPSVIIFRYSHTRLDLITKARYHKLLASFVKGTKAPAPADEQTNPRGTDEIYAAWSHYLRSNTRDTKKYPLLFKENINYGYRRNVWGLRPIGIAISMACVIASMFRIWFIQKAGGHNYEEIFGALIASVLFLVLWLFRFTADWVRVPADAYAERLAETVETMATPKTAKRKS